MLSGTPRHASEVVAVVPPDLAECTVEKVAINAVMAGCRPEFMPVILAAVEAACTDEFNIQGVLATTDFVSQLTRPGQSRQRDDRSRCAADYPQRGRWPAWRCRSGDARQSGQVH